MISVAPRKLDNSKPLGNKTSIVHLVPTSISLKGWIKRPDSLISRVTPGWTTSFSSIWNWTGKLTGSLWCFRFSLHFVSFIFSPLDKIYGTLRIFRVIPFKIKNRIVKWVGPRQSGSFNSPSATRLSQKDPWLSPPAPSLKQWASHQLRRAGVPRLLVVWLYRQFICSHFIQNK